MSKVVGYYVPFVMNAVFAIHALILFILGDNISKYFNFVSTVFIIFPGYTPLKNRFDLSFDISIYISIKQSQTLSFC